MHFGMAFPEIHDPAAAALGLLHDKEPYTDQDQDRQHIAEHAHPPRRLFRRFGNDIDIGITKCRQQGRISRCIGCKRRTIFQLADDGMIIRDLYSVYFLLLDLIHEIRIRDFGLV